VIYRHSLNVRKTNRSQRHLVSHIGTDLPLGRTLAQCHNSLTSSIHSKTLPGLERARKAL
jgi:hypothetical protein